MTKWIEKFMEILKSILLWPIYPTFIFVGSIFLIISLSTKNYFEQIFILFLYSTAGSVWRYIEKDMISGIEGVIKEDKNKKISNLINISIYHIGNIILLFALLHYLKFL